MADGLRDFRDFSRCWAPVDWKTIDKRASGDTSRRCSRPGHVKVAGHMYCSAHFKAWETHHSILERIRSIQSRDIV